jgi:hypothetical protein
MNIAPTLGKIGTRSWLGGAAGGAARLAGNRAVGVFRVPEPDGERPAGFDRLGSAAASGGIQEETTILGVPLRQAPFGLAQGRQGRPA